MLSDFIDSLTSVKDDYQWQTRTMIFGGEPLHLIRGISGGEYVCPLMAVARKHTGCYFGLCDRDKAADALGLHRYDGRVIQNASDMLMNYRTDVRAAILEKLQIGG